MLMSVVECAMCSKENMGCGNLHSDTEMGVQLI